MAEKFLIDTSAVIKYLNVVFPARGISFLDQALNDESFISFITEIELQVWNPLNLQDVQIYRSFVEQSNIVKIDQGIIDKTIEIRKSVKIKLPDALIAATAIVHNRTLIADNDKDFKRVPDLKFINPRRLNFHI